MTRTSRRSDCPPGLPESWHIRCGAGSPRLRDILQGRGYQLLYIETHEVTPMATFAGRG